MDNRPPELLIDDSVVTFTLLPPWWVRWGGLIVLFVWIGVMAAATKLWAGEAWITPFCISWIAILIAAGVVPSLRERVMWKREGLPWTEAVCRRLIENPSLAVRDACPIALPTYLRMYLGAFRRVGTIVERICATGRVGTVYIISMGPWPTELNVTPLQAPFEPVPLDTADARFRAIRTCDDQQTGGGRAVDGHSTSRRGGLPSHETNDASGIKHLMRRVTTLAGAAFCIYGGFAFLNSFQMFEATCIAALLLMLGCLLCWVAVVPVSFGPDLRTYVFPGGLAFPHRYSRSYTVARRERGAIILARRLQSQSVMVLQGRKRVGIPATPAIAELVIRAWRSPQPAPTDEQLSAYFGGAKMRNIGD